MIQSTPLVGGTDWENPIDAALAMEPAPEVIFFMTDGAMKGRDMVRLARSLATKAKRTNTIINSVALMEPNTEEAMAELAARTGGQFTIVEKDGSVRRVSLTEE